MPQGDGTGPTGTGPMTGKQAGCCGGHDMPEYSGRSFGRGMGRCRGFQGGPGRGRNFMARGGNVLGQMPYARSVSFTAPTQEEEKRFLEKQSEVLQSQMDEIRKQIDTLAGPKA